MKKMALASWRYLLFVDSADSLLFDCAQARARQEKVKNEYLLLLILIVSVYAQQVGRQARVVEQLLIA